MSHEFFSPANLQLKLELDSVILSIRSPQLLIVKLLNTRSHFNYSGNKYLLLQVTLEFILGILLRLIKPLVEHFKSIQTSSRLIKSLVIQFQGYQSVFCEGRGIEKT